MNERGYWSALSDWIDPAFAGDIDGAIHARLPHPPDTTPGPRACSASRRCSIVQSVRSFPIDPHNGQKAGSCRAPPA